MSITKCIGSKISSEISKDAFECTKCYSSDAFLEEFVLSGMLHAYTFMYSCNKYHAVTNKTITNPPSLSLSLSYDMTLMTNFE